MTRVLALADQSKIGCITQRRFAKVGTKTHPQRGADLDRNGLSVSTETACRFEPKSPVGNSEICTRTNSFNDFAGVAAQRCNPKRRLGVSRDDSAMACRSICSPPKAGEACAQRGIANLCGGTIGRRRRRSEWGSCSRPGGALERPPAWTAEASAVGKRLEPGADCSPLASRLPGR